jgi:hypothetical protein
MPMVCICASPEEPRELSKRRLVGRTQFAVVTQVASAGAGLSAAKPRRVSHPLGQWWGLVIQSKQQCDEARIGKCGDDDKTVRQG